MTGIVPQVVGYPAVPHNSNLGTNADQLTATLNAAWVEIYSYLNPSPVTATLGASQDNYAPTGYVAGSATGGTNQLYLTAAVGGSMLLGLLAAIDGWVLEVFNFSTTDIITIPHQASSIAANNFCLPGAAPAYINMTGSSKFKRVANQWWPQ